MFNVCCEYREYMVNLNAKRGMAVDKEDKRSVVTLALGLAHTMRLQLLHPLARKIDANHGNLDICC